MNDYAYMEGMAEAFEKAGATRVSAVKVAGIITEMKKKAQAFDYAVPEQNSSFDWKSLIIPMLALGLGGFIGYQSRDKGSGDRSPFGNVKNYFANTARGLVRKGPRPIYDYKKLLDL